MPSTERVQALIARVVEGKYDGAIEEFYTEDATMQENLATPPRAGRAHLVAHEQGVIAAFPKITATSPGPCFVDGDHSVVRWRFEFTDVEGKTRTIDELAYQRWRGDRIAEERFYYDPAQMR